LQFETFDESYLDRLRSGDPRTQAHFFAYFNQLMQLKLRSRLRTTHEIEDVKQETFTRFFTALRQGKIRQPDRLGPYVNSMCANVLREQYRDHDSKVATIDDDSGSNEIPDPVADVEGFVLSKQLQEKVRQILDQMPERDRRILKGIFIEERDKNDVCRDFGVHRDYLRVLLHRAKLAFKAEYLKTINRPPPGQPAVGAR
jgi:RNA polymerase sigma-70 factor (ECF subfamily)